MKTKKDNTKGLWIEQVIWERTDLNITEKCLLAKIQDLDNENGCFASNDYLGKFMMKSPKTISSLIGGLIEKKYVQLIGNDGRKRYIRVPKIKGGDENEVSNQKNQNLGTSREENAEHINIDSNIDSNLNNTPLPESKGEVGEPTKKDSHNSLVGTDINAKIIDKVFDEFQKTNPAITNSRKRPNQRKAILDLLDIHGDEGLMEIVSIAIDVRHEMYMPVINDPLQLYMKQTDFCLLCRRNGITFKHATNIAVSKEENEKDRQINRDVEEFLSGEEQ